MTVDTALHTTLAKVFIGRLVEPILNRLIVMFDVRAESSSWRLLEAGSVGDRAGVLESNDAAAVLVLTPQTVPWV